jgi:hypothetical protein
MLKQRTYRCKCRSAIVHMSGKPTIRESMAIGSLVG